MSSAAEDVIVVEGLRKRYGANDAVAGIGLVLVPLTLVATLTALLATHS